jgi:hypothetical protein
MIIFTPTLVISCVIIFVLLHLFINTIDDSKKWLNTILALLITPIMYFYIWYPISTIFLPYHHNKHFDSETWIEKPGLRYEMIDNMIKTNFLEGKSKEEIGELLGNVEWLSWNTEINDFDTNVWNYGLGLIPGAFQDTKEDVEISFKNNKVTKVNLSQATYIFVKEKETPSNKKLDSINTTFKKK